MPSTTNNNLSALRRQNLLLEFLGAKHATPKGIYLTPKPSDPFIWTGVLFVRRGPYAPTILRFQLSFPTDYPERPPIIKFFTDIFHPLITPLTTYTYTTNDTGADTVSATDEERLPPGGFSLQHGFPHWLGRIKGDAVTSTQRPESPGSVGVGPAAVPQVASDAPSPPATIQPRAVHIVEVLYYLRSTFESESVLDSVPLEAAGNPGAWHAWRTHRAGMIGRPSTVPQPGADTTLASPTSRQQTRGARRPGEWNWEGVWEERVRKGMQMSVSEHVLYGGTSPSDDLINFTDLAPEVLEQAATPLEQVAASQ